MPTYESACVPCNGIISYVRKVDDRNDVPLCPNCGGTTERIIHTAPKGFVKGKFEPFISNVDGSLISSEQSMREHNARNGVVNMADGYDTATIMKGDYLKPDASPKPEDIKKDIAEATYMVEQGYKPVKEVQEDE